MPGEHKEPRDTLCTSGRTESRFRIKLPMPGTLNYTKLDMEIILQCILVVGVLSC